MAKINARGDQGIAAYNVSRLTAATRSEITRTYVLTEQGRVLYRDSQTGGHYKLYGRGYDFNKLVAELVRYGWDILA